MHLRIGFVEVVNGRIRHSLLVMQRLAADSL
jgi:hypothetical protein